LPGHAERLRARYQRPCPPWLAPTSYRGWRDGGRNDPANFQIVIDNDIYSMVQRVLRGFAVNEDSLAVEVIAHAMDSGRNFLKEQHSRRYLRSGEIWGGRLGVQESGYDMWQNAGAPDVLQRAQAEAQRILATHSVPPLSPEQTRELDRIMQSAYAHG
jgi:trimethylamine--corrinoid protein Co-methyltransferase